jgi:glycosyltransferase involved in cell wall biosynthesis
LSATSGDQVTDGLDGIIVDPDPRSVADGVERMILDPELRRRLGKAAAESKPEHEDIRRFLQLLEK